MSESKTKYEKVRELGGYAILFGYVGSATGRDLGLGEFASFYIGSDVDVKMLSDMEKFSDDALDAALYKCSCTGY